MRFLENRIPPPLVALVAALIMIAISEFLPATAFIKDDTVKLLAMLGLLILAGCFLVPAALSFRAANTTVNPLKPETAAALVTTGVYRFTRNPMYVGMLFVLCALLVYLNSISCIAIVFLFTLYIQRFQIKPEERALDIIFGQAYLDYKQKVRPWI